MGISHDSILLNTGDGSNIVISGSSSSLSNDVTEWHYSATHNYFSAGSYVVSVTDSFRIGGIQNIASSAIESINLQQNLFISPGLGVNSSPELMNSQINTYSDGAFFYHDPMAVDPDGDSLVFSLVPTSSGVYTQPAGSIDPNTGLVKIAAQTGILAINIQIDEIRNGNIIGTSFREMHFDSRTIGLNPYFSDRTNIDVYPNPFQDRLIIESSNYTQSIFLLRDLFGKDILRGELSFDQEEIDLSSLPNGTYFITFYSKELATTQKVIKY